MTLSTITSFLPDSLTNIAEKVLNAQRVSAQECLSLYKEADIGFLGMLANAKNHQLNQEKVFFNKNFHVEPSNECRFHCKFCSYRRDVGQGYALTQQEVLAAVQKAMQQGATEMHMVGSAHPEWDVDYYVRLLSQIKNDYPALHIKAFSAVEIHHMCELSGLSFEEGLQQLKTAGLESLPGGGAEILIDDVRKNICSDKTDSKTWLEIHRIAHKLGLPSNATMLYGHIETYEERVEHMAKLRTLQDETLGFNAFIPLKFLSSNNDMSEIEQVSVVEDMKNYAIARIFMDNIPHIKAYWPMIGKEEAAMALHFGVDDLDGTIDDSTTIYTTAGSKEQKPSMSSDEIVRLITENDRIPVERDSVYNELKVYSSGCTS